MLQGGAVGGRIGLAPGPFEPMAIPCRTMGVATGVAAPRRRAGSSGRET